jgi:hypothetical protein
MGWLEAVVVVYLRTAIGLNPAVVIPAQDPATVGTFEAVEIARELATLVMIGAIGWLAGRSALERLAWAAVVFGIWDIIYYAGLRIVLGWPPAFDTWDVLFLVPAAWVGPVWAPIAVSVALVGFGLAAARRLRSGSSIALRGWHVVAAVAGGVLVVTSFLVDADRVLRGESAAWTGWPIFGLGMALAIAASTHALRRGTTLLLVVALAVGCSSTSVTPGASRTAAPSMDHPTAVAATPPMSDASATPAPATRATPLPTGSAGPSTPASTPSPPPEPSPSPETGFTIPGAWAFGPSAPLALTEVAAAAHDGRIWVAGGLDGRGRASARVLVLDPSTGAWTDGPELPERVHHAALVSTGDALFLIGGYIGQFPGPPTAAVHRLDLGTDAWAGAPSLPVARAAGAAAWDGERIVYGGGWSEAGRSDEVLAFDGAAWHAIARLSLAREHLAAASDGAGRTWLLGGRESGLNTNVGIVELVRGDSARRLRVDLTARGGVAGFWHPALGACLAGGEGPRGTFDEVECVDDADDLRALPPLAAPRHGLGAAVLGDTVFIVLGGPEPGLFVSDVVETLALTRGQRGQRG